MQIFEFEERWLNYRGGVPEHLRIDDCVFCQISDGKLPAQYVHYGVESYGIIPLNPVTPGHVIFIPHEHYNDLAERPDITGYVTADAATYVSRHLEDANIITSRGRAATQSVFHLHIHVVPRSENDGLALPWYSGRTN